MGKADLVGILKILSVVLSTTSVIYLFYDYASIAWLLFCCLIIFNHRADIKNGWGKG